MTRTLPTAALLALVLVAAPPRSRRSAASGEEAGARPTAMTVMRAGIARECCLRGRDGREPAAWKR
jgi:hypothetical protein